MPTKLVFVGSERDELLSLVVDEAPSSIGAPGVGPFVQLTRRDQPIWVNLSNVLYLEAAEEAQPGDFAA